MLTNQMNFSTLCLAAGIILSAAVTMPGVANSASQLKPIGSSIKAPRTGGIVVDPAGTQGVAELTYNECKNLGGTVVQDSNCPWVIHDGRPGRAMCKTSGGNQLCINEAD